MQLVILAFFTGLTTGGFSCLAVQGGLLASSIAGDQENREDKGERRDLRRHRLFTVTIFLIAKLISYTILGFLLGLAGSALTFSPQFFGIVQILVGLFMLTTVGRILDIHPIFRYFVIQPPRWAYRMLKHQSRDSSLLAPAILGMFTVFMPCGITQATMAVAIASGSALAGAAIMFAFVLGTSPIFFALGASFVEMLSRRAFRYAAAGVVAVFAALSINGGLAATGSIYTVQNFYRAATTNGARVGTSASLNANGVAEVTIVADTYGYKTATNILNVGVPVRLTLTTNNTQGCIRAFTIPALNISKILPPTGQEVIEFTPQKKGRLAYACSMGMYTGSFIVQ